MGPEKGWVQSQCFVRALGCGSLAEHVDFFFWGGGCRFYGLFLAPETGTYARNSVGASQKIFMFSNQKPAAKNFQITSNENSEPLDGKMVDDPTSWRV